MIIYSHKFSSKVLSFLVFLVYFIDLSSLGISAADGEKPEALSLHSQSLTASKPNQPALLVASQRTLLGHEFSDPSLGIKALAPRTKEFERLEFLGDRVFGLVAAHVIYKCYPFCEVGLLADEFSRLVSKGSLVTIYKGWNIDPGAHASSCYQPPVVGPIARKTASDVVEAFIGAVYKDSGFAATQTFGSALIRTYFKLSNDVDLSHLPKPSLATQKRVNASIHARKLPVFLEVIGYKFTDDRLLYEALQHPSVGGSAFKKLDFIGVRVLALAIAEKVFNDFPDAEEGQLMAQNEQIINNDNIARVFQTWQLWRYLAKQHNGIIGAVLAPQVTPPRMASSTVRTLIGAIYLDGGWEQALSATHKLLFSEPPQDFYKPLVRFTDLIRIQPTCDASPILQAVEDWPTLVDSQAAPTQSLTVTTKTSLSTSPTNGPANAVVVSDQPTYLEASKRKVSDKQAQRAKNSKPEEAWPALNAKKLPASASSLSPTALPSGRNAQAWKDPASTIKSVGTCPDPL